MATGEGSVQSNQSVKQADEEIGDTNVIGRRTIAVIIDTAILIFALAALLNYVVAPVIRPNLAMILLTVILGQFFYFYVLEGLTGRTVGKFLMRIEVCREDGSTIDFSDSFTRNIWRVIDNILSYVVGFLVIMSSDENQRLGDKRADTLVVKR